MRAEDVYAFLLEKRVAFGPGWWETIEVHIPVTDSQTPTRWNVPVQILANPIWRRGRAFFRCPGCTKRATRLYVPVSGSQPRCRRCWGLSYESQSWSYKATGFLGRLLGPVAWATTSERRKERREAARARYESRRGFF